MLESLTRFVTVLGTKTVAVIFVCTAIFIFMVVRLELLMQPGYMLATCTLAFVVIAVVSITNMFKPAAAAAVVTLLLVALQAKAPAVTESAQTMAEVGQKHIGRTAREMTRNIPRRVACDQTTAREQVFFETNVLTEEPIVAMWYSREDDRVQCWDSPGRHPQTGEKLSPVDKGTVAEIKKQLPETESEQISTEGQSELKTVQVPKTRGRRQTLPLPEPR